METINYTVNLSKAAAAEAAGMVHGRLPVSQSGEGANDLPKSNHSQSVKKVKLGGA
jgi:hypothetical protein